MVHVQEVLRDFQSLSHTPFLLTLKKSNSVLPKTNYPNSQKGPFLHRNLQPTGVYLGPNLGQHLLPWSMDRSNLPPAQVAKLRTHTASSALKASGLESVWTDIAKASSGKGGSGNALGFTYCKCCPMLPAV